jgi:hypothetical protein
MRDVGREDVMRTRLQRGAVLALMVSFLPLTGCFSVVKQAYYEVRGAQGEVLIITQPDAAALARAAELTFSPATTTIGPGLCPSAVLRAYDRSANQLVARLRPRYPGGEPQLAVTSDVQYFQKKGLLSGGLLLARVRMTVAGQPALDALVKSESQSFREGGEDDLADAAVAALGEFLARPATPGAGERAQ